MEWGEEPVDTPDVEAFTAKALGNLEAQIQNQILFRPLCITYGKYRFKKKKKKKINNQS